MHSYVLKSLRARVLGQVALNPLVELSETALKAHFPKGAVIRLKGLLSEVPEGLQSESDCLHLADRILTMIEQECEQEHRQNQSSPSDESSLSGQDKNSAQSPQDNCADDSHAESEDETLGNPDLPDQGSPDDDSTHPPKAASSQPQDNDGDTGITEPNPMLDALLNADEGDIDPDIFDTIKSALALAQDTVSDVVLPIGDEPTLDAVFSR